MYKYFDETDQIIYVGKAKNLHRRVNSYFNKDHDSLKTRNLVKHIRRIEYIVVGSEQEAFLLENNLIKQYQPHYNILLKDGKSYPSICITREEYPRIFKTRNIVRGAGQYFGPYSFTNTVDLILELIHKLYPLRTCATPMTESSICNGRHKVCLKYHLGTCCGICEHKKGSENYRHWIDEAKDIIRGDAAGIQRQIWDEMMQASAQMQYEKAAELKTKYELIDQFCSKTVITGNHIGDADIFGFDEQNDTFYISMLHIHNGSIVQGKVIEIKRQLDETREEILAYGIMELKEQLGSKCRELVVPFIPDGLDDNYHINIATTGDRKKLLDLAQKNVQQYKADRLKQADKLNPDQRAMRVLTELQKLLNLPVIPLSIESFDNSNIQGTDAVAGCVVFRKAKPCKSEYKKFTIKTVVGADDYASMREVVYRKYSRAIEEGTPLPDLILADGGVGQMHAIEEAVHQMLGLSIPVAGLKKDDKHHTNTIVMTNPDPSASDRIVELQLPVTSEVFRLMVAIQDEVHRFAITYHKNKRSKSQVHSQLDDIQGVGEVTKQKILQHFGSVRSAGMADEAEWQKMFGKNRGSVLYREIQAKISR